MRDQEPPRVYAFGDFVVDARHRLLTSAAGGPIALSGRAFDALVYFVEHAGDVLPRSTLAKALWPNTVVEDNNLNQLISVLRRALGDDGSKHRYVVTVAGRGYQFVADVRRVEPADTAPEPGPRAESRAAATAGLANGAAPRSNRRRAAVLGMVLASVVMLAGVVILGGLPSEAPSSTDPGAGTGVRAGGTSQALPLERSLAVLPFRNLSPRPEDAYFASGLHEEVVNRLAKLRGVSVIALGSVMAYADVERPIPIIAQELNVAAVLEAGVRYSGDRVRVSVQLADGQTGMQMWAEVYEGTLADIFAIQADIASRISTALESELSPTERMSLDRRPTESVEAYARYLQAVSLHREHGAVGVSMSSGVRATLQKRLGEAIELDSTFADAHALRAHIHLDSLVFDRIEETAWLERRAELVAAAEEAATRAATLNPALGSAHGASARLNMYTWRLADAKTALDRAAAAEPHDAAVLHWTTVLRCLSGDYSEAVQSARRAIALDPRNPATYSPLSMALLATGDVDGAVAALEDMVDVAPTAALGYISLARMEVVRGNDAAAVEALRLGEQFLAATGNNLQLDAALSYARLGRAGDAERLVAAFKHAAAGRHVDPGILAWTELAVGRYDEALTLLQTASSELASGMDMIPLLLVRLNAWADPVLEQPEWVELRSRLEYRRSRQAEPRLGR